MSTLAITKSDEQRNTTRSSMRRMRIVAITIAVSFALGALLQPIHGQTRRPSRGAQAAAQSATNQPAGVRQERGFATGRVTLPDGSPLPASVEEVKIYINGISSAGVNVGYQPIVRANGTYRQPLVAGDYRFSRGFVKVRHKDRTFEVPLEPVGDLHSKSRSAAGGIVQNFIWKATGPTPIAVALGPDPGNHTNWYGMRVGTSPGGWRIDYTDDGSLVNRGRAPREIPEGTRVTLTLRPLTPAFDRRELTGVTLERTVEWTSRFHDLPPADYELTGFAVLPSGARHTLVFRGSEENRLGFVASPRVNVEWDQWLGHFAERTLVYYLEGLPPGVNPTTTTPPVGNNARGGSAAQGFTVGAAIEIEWRGQWYKGTIKAVRGGNRWLVGYDGYGTEWDEEVGLDRIRPRQ